MNNSKISIIIPIYNSEKYLKRCLDSVIFQSLKEIEIICIDDCSTDNSLNIVEQYQKLDIRIKLYKNESNMGTAYCRNFGIDKSQGDIIGFVDSDDTISSEMYEKLLFNMNNFDANIVFCNFNYLDENSNIYKTFDKFKNRLSNEEIFRKILSNEFSSSACIGIYKKELFYNKNIFYPNNIIYEDPMTTYKLVYFADKVSILEEKLYNYHDNSESITRNLTNKHFDDIFYVIEDTKQFLKKHNIFDIYSKEYLQRVESFINLLIYKLKKFNVEIERIYKLIEYLWLNIEMQKYDYEIHFSKKMVWLYSSYKVLEKDKFYLKEFGNKLIIDSHLVKVKDLLYSKLGLSSLIVKQLEKKQIYKLYLYGAGEISKKLIPEIENLSIEILGIIDSHAKKNDSLLGYSVNKFEDIDFQSKIIVVSSEYSAYEITTFLENQVEDFEIINFYSIYKDII